MAAKNSEHRYENNDVTVTLRILQSCALTISYCFSADLAGQKLGLSYSLSGLAGHYIGLLVPCLIILRSVIMAKKPACVYVSSMGKTQNCILQQQFRRPGC